MQETEPSGAIPVSFQCDSLKNSNLFSIQDHLCLTGKAKALHKEFFLIS